jgi:AmiR/NasT family two-component response regulator
MNTTLLLVEDDRLVLHTLAQGLRAAGYNTLEAQSPERAMQLAAITRPDLALLDMRLPGMSGIELGQWLKTELGVHFLFLSAYDDAETVETAASIGALGYLVKPLNVQQILPSIRTALLRAGEITRLHQAGVDLTTALHASRNISVAIGLLMERYGTEADATFEALRAYSRSRRMRVIDVADQVVERRADIDFSAYLGKHEK